MNFYSTFINRSKAIPLLLIMIVVGSIFVSVTVSETPSSSGAYKQTCYQSAESEFEGVALRPNGISKEIKNHQQNQWLQESFAGCWLNNFSSREASFRSFHRILNLCQQKTLFLSLRVIRV